MNSNKDNPGVGREFEELAVQVLGRHFGVDFELGVAIPIKLFLYEFLPEGTKKIIIMKKATHRKRAETLAEYYCRTYLHLLQGVSLLELDTESESIVTLKEYFSANT